MAEIPIGIIDYDFFEKQAEERNSEFIAVNGEITALGLHIVYNIELKFSEVFIMKHEWRKHEKEIYLPKKGPQLIDVPKLSYFMIEGAGNPNSDEFAKNIEVLYLLSYAVRMSYKTDFVPKDYFEYTVYPLEGIWDISEKAKLTYDGTLDKDELVYKLMIRQPDFLTKEFADEFMLRIKDKKKNDKIDDVKFIKLDEGKCIQMLHLGSYDKEKETFDIMEKYCEDNGMERLSNVHKEIYLSDARKVSAEKLKTVLRFSIE